MFYIIFFENILILYFYYNIYLVILYYLNKLFLYYFLIKKDLKQILIIGFFLSLKHKLPKAIQKKYCYQNFFFISGFKNQPGVQVMCLRFCRDRDFTLTAL